MAHYDKKLGVYLPEKPTTPIEIEKPKKKIEIPDPIEEKLFEKTKLPEIYEEPTLEPIVEIETITIEEPIPLSEEEMVAIRKAELIAEIKALEGKEVESLPPYRHEVDEDEVDWWICNTCEKAYNSETVQKRHQTLKHK